ncbi:ankyrin repeat domain-containing protein [Chitinophagaceae bacterium MMS25-I14]
MLETAIRSRNFQYALALIGNGEKLPEDLDKYTKKSIYDILIQAKEFNILHLLVLQKTIETDIYEYDSFDHSFFDSIVSYMPQDNETDDFFDVFIGHFTNVNDEVRGDSLLSYALKNGANLRTIQALINFDCDTNYRNDRDENLIHLIITSSESRANLSPEEKLERMYEYINLLANMGVEIDAANSAGETPLISTLKFRKEQFLDVLLAYGASPNHRGDSGNNAFYYAIIWAKSLDAYRKLCEYEAPQLNELNTLGATVLFEFAGSINNDRTVQDREILKQLVADGADLHQTCLLYGEEKTPIELIAGKSTDILKAVLETGNADINHQDNHGNTLLHKVCAAHVMNDAEKARETYRKVKLLLDNGADPSISNDKDETALMLASDDNLKIKTVELLMKQSK